MMSTRAPEGAVSSPGARVRFAVAAASLAVVWALAVPSSSDLRSEVSAACADPVQLAQAGSTQSGCCHYNGGVCGCQSGSVQCCDGKMSASCRCGNAPPTRQSGSSFQPLLLVDDVAFADQNAADPPRRRLNWFRLGGDTLWIWLKVRCSDTCWEQLAPGGTLGLELRWLFDPGSGPLLQGEPQRIALSRGQQATFVPRPAERLKTGRWETEIRFDTERLCTRNGDCWFPIDVRP